MTERESVKAPRKTPLFSHDLSGYDDLVEDVFRPPSTELVISELEIVSFLKEGEKYIEGDEMKRRARELDANLGQRHAEFILEKQNEIPEEWQEYTLVFPGTVWKQELRGYRVPYLCWYAKRWELRFYSLKEKWVASWRFVRLRK